MPQPEKPTFAEQFASRTNFNADDKLLLNPKDGTRRLVAGCVNPSRPRLPEGMTVETMMEQMRADGFSDEHIETWVELHRGRASGT